MKYCAACNKPLKVIQLDKYYQCFKCKSYTFISNNSGTEHNRVYFNKIFNKISNYKIFRLKAIIFNFFLKIDYKINSKDYKKYYTQRNINNKIFHDKKVCEIGFGEGFNLVKLLESGIEAYGVDISKTAVNNFKKKYPKYKNKVFYNIRLLKKVDIVYCSALFEHLDNPQKFIRDVNKILNKSGIIIIDNLPVVNEGKSNLTIDNDINFWKPLHRVIYSKQGLTKLFDNFKFKLLKFALIDDFNYRVLSQHINEGYENIIHLRNPNIKTKNLPDLCKFFFICKNAINIKSLALSGIALFKKI